MLLVAVVQQAASLDCKVAVNQPVDPAPIRSPQEIHTILAQRFADKDIAEIGTRNGDGINCFARVAKSAVAIEMDPEYCKKLKARSQELKSGGLRSYSIHCGMYQENTPDADIYTWWQQAPHLVDAEMLDEVRAQRLLLRFYQFMPVGPACGQPCPNRLMPPLDRCCSVRARARAACPTPKAWQSAADS